VVCNAAMSELVLGADEVTKRCQRLSCVPLIGLSTYALCILLEKNEWKKYKLTPALTISWGKSSGGVLNGFATAIAEMGEG
jgi:hypothetical protein